MPANSKTVLIEPPAITPVPGAAGLISTLAAPSLPLDKVGIELFGVKGTLTRFFLPSETPFHTAPITSPAFPTPTPTCPFSLPTTTIALKLIFFPPFTVLDTRLI